MAGWNSNIGYIEYSTEELASIGCGYEDRDEEPEEDYEDACDEEYKSTTY